MTKNILKKIIVYILNWESRLILRKYKPKIIGITGSVGKTSTKEAVAAVMAMVYRIRKSEKSYNSELGIPLTIIGCHTAWNSIVGWLVNIYRGLLLIITKQEYPEWLILEVGADRPGDIKSVVRWIKFDVAIVSRLPDVPVHIEFFKSKEQVIDEKMSLPLSVRADGLVILNTDDQNIMSRQDKIKGKIITYGFGENAQVKASNDHIMYEEASGISTPIGFAFKVDCEGSNVPVRITGALGNHLVYPVLAAIATGTNLGVNLVKAIETLATHVPPPGRLHLLPGLNNSTLLDDTYNSSPVAVVAAIKTLEQIETTGRKIAVLGDMMELGNHTAEEHRRVGELVAPIVDIFISVGVRSKFTHEAVLTAGLSSDKVFHFDRSDEAGEFLKTIISTGDIILFKGSQSIRMEKAVALVLSDKVDKAQSLVRQDDEWLNR